MNVYDKLGVRTFINAAGTYTIFSGTLMHREVVDAMAEAATAFVDLRELHRKAGAYIAHLTGAEDAFISSGAAGGLLSAAAACIAGDDPEQIRRLPDTTGMKDEIVIQRSHRCSWDQAASTAGARLIEVDAAPDAIRHAIGPKTAALLYFIAHSKTNSVSLEEIVAIAREADLPLIVDAAAELPPPENLFDLPRMGVDLTLFSGGKGLKGPQASGLVLGRKGLIEACRLNSNPYASIGRPMKVGKEEIIGLVVAVDLYVRRDHEAEHRKWEGQVQYILDALGGFPGVIAEHGPDRTGDIPNAFVRLDPTTAGMTVDDLIQKLREGIPGIEVNRLDDGIRINPHIIADGDERIIARRLREIFSEA